MSEKQVRYSFFVHDVSVSMDERHIMNDLMERYVGVEKVSRRFYHDEKDGVKYPRSSIRVSFTTDTDVKKIQKDGTIVIGSICRRVDNFKEYDRQQSPKSGQNQNQQNGRKPLCEQDILDMFEEQKKTLAGVLNSFDKKLNDVINHDQNKTTQIALSNKA